jgi:hypothetical protein
LPKHTRAIYHRDTEGTEKISVSVDCRRRETSSVRLARFSHP